MRAIRGALTAALAASMVACGGNGDDASVPPPPPDGGLPPPSNAPALKDNLAARYGVLDFPIGAAIEPASTTNADRDILARHFSSVTAENAMKPDTVWPSAPGTGGVTAQPAPAPDFSAGDVLAAFAAGNGMRLRGHTLLWHQTAPAWFFAGDPAGDPVGYRAAVRQRLRDYIFAVIRHFPDVYAWDVVNEVATDTPNAANPYRTGSPWYTAYGAGGADPTEYVRDAFLFAGQARASIGRDSSSMKLMLNDYNTELPGKRANVLAIVQDLLNAGSPIDGVGHQLHLQLDADVAQVTAAFQAVEALPGALVNHVTELDVSLYADPGDCYAQRTIPPCQADHGAAPPSGVLSQQAVLYRALFTAFGRPSVTSVTTWGLADNHTWLNFFPVDRVNRPLLFDAERNPKAAFWAVVDPAFVIP